MHPALPCTVMGRGWTLPGPKWKWLNLACTDASLCLVQLLKPHGNSCSCCFLTSETCSCLLHPGRFKGWDLNFQSSHVKSHHLLFLILYTAFLIFFQYLCLRSAPICVCLCMRTTGRVLMPAEGSEIGTNAFFVRAVIWHNASYRAGYCCVSWGLQERKMSRGDVMPWKRF